MDAAHVLSHFPAWVHRLNPRMALAGLTVMVCECARMNPVNNFIARHWSKNMYVYNNEMDVFNYGRTSGELLTWKSKGYDNPCPISQLQDIYLVLKYRLYHPPHQGNVGGTCNPTRKSEVASDAYSSGNPTSQPDESSDASSSSGSENTSDSGSSQPWEADDAQGRGRPRVELLAMRANLEGIMVDLVLTGPCTSISAYGCFAIKIDIPAEATGSSKGDANGSIKWEWDCYDPEYADEVDKPPVTLTISSSGPGRNVEVTYAVMSNALEATMQVKMWCIGGNSSCSVYGNIIARIGDFKHRIILFRCTQGMSQRLSPTDMLVLQLSRSVLAVPCDWVLHIEVGLQIETYSNNREANPQHFNTVLDFANGMASRCHEVDGNVVEVNVTWYPDYVS
ncbi:60 kDa jasmonate-induced protein-like [Miscanthus floridulus]|uniref:60 kDa jasmonate-induced protein-like n=1 Tax=Miscanthus floridulus TaxID=154761 RepID=UPI0034595C51